MFRRYMNPFIFASIFITAILASGCSYSGDREAEVIPLMAYLESDETQYLIDLAAQPYELNSISISYGDDSSHEVLILDGNAEVINSIDIKGLGADIGVDTDTAYISFSASEDEKDRLLVKGCLSAEAQEARKRESILIKAFDGKSMAVLGDSISAYYGYIPTGYEPQYPTADVELSDMWWYRVAKRLGMDISRINACAGSGVTEYSWAFRSVDRLASDRRTAELDGIGAVPDIIFVWIGANDVFGGAPMDLLISAYRAMVEDIKRNYPESHIYLCTYYNTGEEDIWLNTIIRDICTELDVELMDIEKCGITSENKDRYILPDGLHPNRDGSHLIGAWVAEQLLKNGE